jgi:hypothetical protein
VFELRKNLLWLIELYTTGIERFAKCLKHSAKSLPSVALGKVFAECGTRQRELGEQCIGNGFFADYFLSGTRKKLCRVPVGTRQRKVAVTEPGNGDDAFAKCSR